MLLCQALSGNFQHLYGKMHAKIPLGMQWRAMCIFPFLRFYNFIKRFCAHIHSILSRPLFLYLISELVQTFRTFTRFDISLVKACVRYFLSNFYFFTK